MAKTDRMSKTEWAGKIAERNFYYTGRGFQKADSRYSQDEVTIAIKVSDDGEVSCDERGCPQPHFGKTATTRSEFSAYKHVVAYHAPLPAAMVQGTSGTKRTVQMVLVAKRPAEVKGGTAAVEEDATEVESTGPTFAIQVISEEESAKRQRNAYDERMARVLQQNRAPPKPTEATVRPARRGR